MLYTKEKFHSLISNNRSKMAKYRAETILVRQRDEVCWFRLYLIENVKTTRWTNIGRQPICE